MNKCRNKTLKNKHKGNTYFPIKYAIHCKNINSLQKSVEILQKIGFKIFKRENYGMYHTFLTPPSNIVKANNFYFVIVIKNGGNKQTLKNNKVQGPHIGFKLKSLKTFDAIYKNICNITRTIIIDKPDEKSLFVDLLCGDIIEFSVKHKKLKSI
jgi:hypothetical protein